MHKSMAANELRHGVDGLLEVVRFMGRAINVSGMVNVSKGRNCHVALFAERPSAHVQLGRLWAAWVHSANSAPLFIKPADVRPSIPRLIRSSDRENAHLPSGTIECDEIGREFTVT